MPIASMAVRGSAIIGKADSGESTQITVDFEGNLYEAANIHTFADRARHAAGRQSVLYPTRARRTVPRIELRQVGWFDSQTGITLLENEQARDALASWLDVQMVEEKELRFSN